MPLTLGPSGTYRILEDAVKLAPAGAIVIAEPGTYKRATTPRATPLTLVARYPAIAAGHDPYANGPHTPQHEGQRSVIEGDRVALPNTGTWQRVTLTGPGLGGAPAGASYVVWKWSTALPTIPDYTFLGYAVVRGGPLTRAGRWTRKGAGMDSVAKCAEFLHTNKTFRAGWFSDGTDMYLLPPPGMGDDPNALCWEVSAGWSLVIGGPDVRLCGFEVRAGGIGIMSGARRAVVDGCLLRSSGIGLYGAKGWPDETQKYYPEDTLIQDSLCEERGLWTAGGAAGAAIPWNFIKDYVIQADGKGYPFNRLGAESETAGIGGSGGGLRTVVRRVTIDGPFNGISYYNAGFDRRSTQDHDIHDVLIRRVADDALEPEQQAVNWRVRRVRIEDTAIALSVGPATYGPLSLKDVTAWRLGTHGVGRSVDGHAGIEALLVKYSGGSTPTARVHLNGVTAWTDQPGVSGLAQNAGGGGNTEAFRLRGCLIRVTKDIVRGSALTTPGRWDEAGNHLVTTDATRPLKVPPGPGTNTAGTNTAAVDALLMNPVAGDLRRKTG